MKKKKLFYSASGWLDGLTDSKIANLDQNDDIEYIALTEEQINWLLEHMPFRCYWKCKDGKLYLDIIDPKELSSHHLFFQETLEKIEEINKEVYTCGLF